MTDKEILLNCSQGDAASFRTLFDRYWDSLYALSVKFVGENDAKDVVQELMIEVWKKHQTLHTDKNGSLKGYLFSLLKYRIIDFVNARPNHLFWDDIVPQMTALIDRQDLFEEAVVRELQQIIDQTLSELRPSELDVFRLRWEQNLSVDITAHILGISSQSVMNRLHNALKTIRGNVYAYYEDEMSAKYQLVLLMFFLSNF
jgi:RNA polymerase sigma-70 factor (ECF subfamily)